ncbi:MAG: DUF4389 domain-containing protein [Gemmatimonadota bacterium]|jgi:hypothetical protein
MEAARDTYPVTLQIDYPDRELDRLTTLFRPIVIIPVAIVLALISGPSPTTDSDVSWQVGGVLFAATALMILFRRKYPRWWYDWNVALTAFGIRVTSYAALLRDEYPATDEDQAVHVEIPYPEAATQLNRWLPLFKWFLAIPHYIALAALSLGAVFAVVFAWFAILFTGRYPRGLFDYVVGVMRWWLRVASYAFLLTTDRYPPFRLTY